MHEPATTFLDLPGALERGVDWHALKPHKHFLFKYMGDEGKAVLCVGALETAPWPRTNANGHVDGWWYGHMTYGLKDLLEGSRSRHIDPFAYPLGRWVVPRWVLEYDAQGARVHVQADHRQEAMRFCDRFFNASAVHWAPMGATAAILTSKEDYLRTVDALMDRIQRGDIYEVNYCTQRLLRIQAFDPFAAFGRIWERQRPLFAAFHRFEERFALGASPERFLAFHGARVVGQPMKGTRPRSADPVQDRALARQLAQDPKERSENIMALDVMRNDLSRIAASASVRVDELCAVHSHPHVHQMTSTVSAVIADGLTVVDVLKATFPMASMTGAPKIRAMELIDQAEGQARGLFSGALGYFAPDGTGDLNVVIRTILHHAGTDLTTLSTGSAITARSRPDQEWEECEVKARSIMDALSA